MNDSGKNVETFIHTSWKGLLLVFWSKLLMDELIYVILLRVLSSRFSSICKDGEFTDSLGICPRAWPLSPFSCSNQQEYPLLWFLSVVSYHFFLQLHPSSFPPMCSSTLTVVVALTWTNSSLLICLWYLETQNKAFFQTCSCKIWTEQKITLLDLMDTFSVAWWSLAVLAILFTKNVWCSDSHSKSDSS